MKPSYLSTWCFSTMKYFFFSTLKYFFFEWSNFVVIIRLCFRSNFTNRSFGSGERSDCSFTDSIYKCFAFSFAGETKLSTVKGWNSLAVRDFVSFARSWNNGSFSLWRGFSIQKALEPDLASHAAYLYWHETNLASIEIEFVGIPLVRGVGPKAHHSSFDDDQLM